MKIFSSAPALRMALAALLGGFAVASPALAQTYTWQNAGSDFTAGANWAPSGPPASTTDIAQFTPFGTFGSAEVNPVLNSAANSRLWFGNTAPGGGYTLSGTGAVTGGSSSASGLITRGIGNTTISLGDGTTTSLALTGNGNIAPAAIDVGYGSTLTLAGNTVATANNLQVRGTLVLDNSAGNPSSQRLTASKSLFLSGGGATVEFKSAGTGSTFSGVTGPLNAQTGYGTVRLNQTGVTGPLAVTLGSNYVSSTASVNFVNAGNGTLGGGGANDPTLKFTTAPSVTNGVLGTAAGLAIVNGSDFAGYDATNGVFAISSTAVSGSLAGGSTVNARITGNASVSSTKTYNTLKIAPSAASQSLAMLSNSTLNAGAILLAGSTNYAITGASGRLLANTSGTGTLFVTNPTTVLSVTASLGTANGLNFSVNKSGDGFLWLNGAANQVAYTLQSPTFTIEAGVLRVNSTSFDLTTSNAPKVALRGGTLEYDVSGAAFTFSRAVGTLSAGQVSWQVSNNSLDAGSGGFSAYAGASNAGAGNGNALTVNLGGSGATLTWGTTASFVGDGEALKFGSLLSNSTVIWQNPLALDGGTAGDYNIRQIDVTKGVGNAADKTQLTGTISGSSTTDLVKTGTGTLELTAANTYAGNTFIQGGTLLLSNGAALADTGAVILGNVAGATLQLGNSETIGALQGGGTTGGNVVLGGNTLTVGDSRNTTFAGAIGGSGGALTKTGSGALTLSNTATYTGATTISGGTLIVGGSIASSSLTTVNAGGTLSGHGTVGALTIASSGVLAPGDAIGTLTAGNTTFAGGGKLVLEVNQFAGAVAGTNYDLLAINGGLTLTATAGNPFLLDLTSLTAGNVAGLADAFDPHANYTLTLLTTTTGISGFDASTVSILTGDFQNTFGGTWTVALTDSDRDLTLSYTGTSPVPEPATYAVLLGAIGLAFAGWRRGIGRRRTFVTGAMDPDIRT